MSHEGNDKLIDQIRDEVSDPSDGVIYEVTIASERIEVLQLIKQILRTAPTLLVKVASPDDIALNETLKIFAGNFEREYEIGPVIKRQLTTSELLEEKSNE